MMPISELMAGIDVVVKVMPWLVKKDQAFRLDEGTRVTFWCHDKEDGDALLAKIRQAMAEANAEIKRPS